MEGDIQESENEYKADESEVESNIIQVATVKGMKHSINPDEEEIKRKLGFIMLDTKEIAMMQKNGYL